jgi:hypothetical protein
MAERSKAHAWRACVVARSPWVQIPFPPLVTTHNQKFLKKIDILFLILFPAIAVVLSLALRTNFLLTTLIFFGAPAIYFSYRTKHRVAKTALFSFIWTVPLVIFVDYIATINGAWFVPHTVFPFRLFGAIPLEDFVWMFLATFNILIFYEHFLDKGKQELVDKRMKYLIWPLFVILLVFFLTLLTRPELLVIPYAYLWIGVIFSFLPSVTFLSFFPRLLSKYVKTASYFFVVGIIFELTGLHLNNWKFVDNGNFIGWVELFGYRFPFEEFFFLFVIGVISVLSYYEFFDDDRK